MATLGTFTAGQVLTAAELNAIGTWTSFTPSWSGLTVGNGTNVGHYCQVNDLLFVRVTFTLGSTSSVGDPVTLTIPASLTIATEVSVYGHTRCDDTGVATYWGPCYPISSTTIRPAVAFVNATYPTLAFVNTTRPLTFGTGDVIAMDFCARLT